MISNAHILSIDSAHEISQWVFWWHGFCFAPNARRIFGFLIESWVSRKKTCLHGLRWFKSKSRRLVLDWYAWLFRMVQCQRNSLGRKWFSVVNVGQTIPSLHRRLQALQHLGLLTFPKGVSNGRVANAQRQCGNMATTDYCDRFELFDHPQRNTHHQNHD